VTDSYLIRKLEMWRLDDDNHMDVLKPHDFSMREKIKRGLIQIVQHPTTTPTRTRPPMLFLAAGSDTTREIM